MAIHYHGTPITPESVRATLAGRNFCVSYFRDDNIEWCDANGQSVMLDNGAFSVWRKGAEIDWRDWARWAERWLERPTNWAVLPDSIMGGVEENERLLRAYAPAFGTQGVPVWHLDEPISRLLDLCDRFQRVCFGSSGVYRVVGTPAWHRRIAEAFDYLADEQGRVPWVHMLRGLNVIGQYPFASADSTNVAQNHARLQNVAAEMASRLDAIQGPSKWERRGKQLALAALSR